MNKQKTKLTNKAIETRKRFNKIHNEESQAVKVLTGLETKIHTHYDFGIASQKVGLKNIFERVMIPQYIKEKKITDAKYSQFSYRLKVIHQYLKKRGYEDEVLFSVGLVQKSKKTRDTVYLYSPEVLEMVHQWIVRENAKRKPRKPKILEAKIEAQ